MADISAFMLQKIKHAMEYVAEAETGKKVYVTIDGKKSNCNIRENKIKVGKENYLEDMWASFMHELYHLLYTPITLEDLYQKVDFIERNAMNLIEDIRIESKAPTLQVSQLFQLNNLKIAQGVLRTFKKQPDTSKRQALVFALLTYGLLGFDMMPFTSFFGIDKQYQKAIPIIEKARTAQSKEVPVLAKKLVAIIKSTDVKTMPNPFKSKSRSQKGNNKGVPDVANIILNIEKRIKKEREANKKAVSEQVQKTVHTFSQVKQTSPAILREKEEFNREVLADLEHLSKMLAEKTLQKIKGLATERYHQSYLGQFSPRLYTRNYSQALPYWFLRRQPAKELQKKKVALLIDVSGSMSGSSAYYAALSGRVFGIVMERLRLPFSILAFDDISYQIAHPEDIIPYSGGGTFPLSAVRKIKDLKQTTVIIITDGIFKLYDFAEEPFIEHLLNTTRFIGIDISSVNIPFRRENIRMVQRIEKLPQIVADTIMSITLR